MGFVLNLKYIFNEMYLRIPNRGLLTSGCFLNCLYLTSNFLGITNIECIKLIIKKFLKSYLHKKQQSNIKQVIIEAVSSFNQ